MRSEVVITSNKCVKLIFNVMFGLIFTDKRGNICLDAPMHTQLLEAAQPYSLQG